MPCRKFLISFTCGLIPISTPPSAIHPPSTSTTTSSSSSPSSPTSSSNPILRADTFPFIRRRRNQKSRHNQSSPTTPPPPNTPSGFSSTSQISEYAAAFTQRFREPRPQPKSATMIIGDPVLVSGGHDMKRMTLIAIRRDPEGVGEVKEQLRRNRMAGYRPVPVKGVEEGNGAVETVVDVVVDSRSERSTVELVESCSCEEVVDRRETEQGVENLVEGQEEDDVQVTPVNQLAKASGVELAMV